MTTIELSTLRHRDVLDTGTATSVGRVEGLVVDPGARTIAALLVGGSSTGNVLIGWSDLTVGPDAVTITSGEALRGATTDGERRVLDDGLTVIAKPVLTDAGEELGVLHDVLVDADSGRIDRLDLGDDPPVPGSALLGVGDHAVIVRHLDTSVPIGP
jgi:sporulation protein YlmC with PRC-barrel domain